MMRHHHSFKRIDNRDIIRYYHEPMHANVSKRLLIILSVMKRRRSIKKREPPRRMLFNHRRERYHSLKSWKEDDLYLHLYVLLSIMHQYSSVIVIVSLREQHKLLYPIYQNKCKEAISVCNYGLVRPGSNAFQGSAQAMDI